MAQMAKKNPKPELLSQVLRYDNSTGLLWWKTRSVELCRSEAEMLFFNKQYAGKPAFRSKINSGYLQGRVLGKTILAHRLIWALKTGEYPKDMIDHINGVRDDNRWGNLRECTQSQNARNSRSRKGSTSQFVGVSWDRLNKKWIAQIYDDSGKRVRIGYYKCEIAAAYARDKAAVKHYGEFAHLNFPKGHTLQGANHDQ